MRLLAIHVATVDWLAIVPSFKIFDHRIAAAPRDDPLYILIAVINLLVFSPGRDKGEVTGLQVLTFFPSLRHDCSAT